MGTCELHVRRRGLALLLLGILTSWPMTQSVASDEDAGAKLFRESNGCVVALENLEGSGSGFVIDKSGLILTNAHVIASPLPFKCTVDVRKGNKVTTVVFKKVKVEMVHPDKDLALVRIDPKEHNATLQVAKLAREKPSPGSRIYAIGNPGGGGMVLNKTITSGMLSGVNRVIDKVAYYQVDAAINPGNSGGPLFNSAGEVIGIVTLKFTDVENTGFAIPLYDLDTKKFVKLKERKSDPERAKALLDQAHKFYARAKEIEKTQRDSQQVKMYFYLSARTFHEALSVDPANDAIYYNIGMLLRALGRSDVASAYLMQAIEMNPWEKRNNQTGKGQAYRELGLSLLQLHKNAEARATLEEGTAKFPTKGSWIWESMAILDANSNDPYHAAYNAQVALQLKSAEWDPAGTKKLLGDMQQKLNPAQQQKLKAEVAKIPEFLKRRQAQADQQFQTHKDFLTHAFADYVKNEGQLATAEDKEPKVVSVDRGPREPEAKTEKADGEDSAHETPKKIALPAGAVDLLGRVSVRQDAFKGTWTEDDNGLASPSLAFARLSLPSKVPDEYDLLIMAERQSNKGELVIGFLRSGKQSAFYFDAHRGTVSGLDPDAREAYQGPVLNNGKVAKIVMKVRREGLMVSVDGKQIAMERSADAFPAVPVEWSVGNDDRLFVGTNTSRFRIYQMALKEYQRK